MKQRGTAGNARKELETRTGEKIITPENFLQQLKKRKKLKAHKNSGKQKQPVENVHQTVGMHYGTGYKLASRIPVEAADPD